MAIVQIKKAAPRSISVTISVDKTLAKVGDTINFIATFSDPTLNVPTIPVSLTDRENKHLANMKMTIVPGEIESVGTGSYIVTQPRDYRVTNAGINHWKNVIPVELVLANELLIRVTD